AKPRTAAPQIGQSTETPRKPGRTSPCFQDISATPAAIATAAAAASAGTRSPRTRPAPISAKSGAVPETAPVSVGPSTSLERNVISVTTAGKNTPTTANMSAASALYAVASTVKGAARTKNTAAVGMLTAAPGIGSRERSPIRPVTSARPK